MQNSRREEVTKLLKRLSAQEPGAEEEVIILLYNDLRKIARHRLANEAKNHTLQPTALVHEAYIRLTQQTGIEWQNRRHFFAMASQAMRRILVDYARRRDATKRPNSKKKLSLDSIQVCIEEQSEDILALDEALRQLAERDPRQAQIVEMRFFGGIPIDEIAPALNISVRTVKRDWSMARAWLYGELTKQHPYEGNGPLGEVKGSI